VNPFTGQSSDVNDRGAIHLLPNTSKCDNSQAVEILLDIICGQEVKIIPPWRKDIEVPQIRDLEQRIEKEFSDIKRIQQEVFQLRSQVQEWDSYRDLLTETGTSLENVVQKALVDIGIKTERTEKGFPADLLSNEVAVEITGIKGCIGVSSDKVIQTGRFKELYHKGEKIILVANTYLDLSPQDRRESVNFSPEVEKYFRSLSICCISTLTFFQLWKDVVTGKRKPRDVKKRILVKTGELTLGDFE
jgi:hypothetical protein